MHSLCWKRAVENLVEGCKAMDGTNDLSVLLLFQWLTKCEADAERSKFAMQLANCHMERSGLPVHPCTNDMQLIEWYLVHHLPYLLSRTHPEPLSDTFMSSLSSTRPITNNPIAFNAYTGTCTWGFFKLSWAGH